MDKLYTPAQPQWGHGGSGFEKAAPKRKTATWSRYPGLMAVLKVYRIVEGLCSCGPKRQQGKNK